jgi:chorismate dehydratase
VTVKRDALRVGRIPYANLFPIFRTLESEFPLEGVRFVEGDPSELNRKLRTGRLDLSPSSSIEYAKHPERYVLCPGVSVASRAKVMSVLLLSRGPIEKLPAGPVGVTTNSDTSVVLLDVLFREFLGRPRRLLRTSLPPAEALRSFPAVLSIGDEAIRAALSGVSPHVTDLGAWWRRETGKPFVFALWIVSRASLAGRGEAIRRFAAMLLSAKRRARKAVRGPLREAMGPAWIPSSFRAEYWRNLSWDLDREIEGMRLFFRLAAKIGRIPAAPRLEFLDIR